MSTELISHMIILYIINKSVIQSSEISTESLVFWGGQHIPSEEAMAVSLSLI